MEMKSKIKTTVNTYLTVLNKDEQSMKRERNKELHIAVVITSDDMEERHQFR